jgi:hypothetical protein
MGFVCSVCGEFHAERLLDIRMTLPEPIHALDEDERARRTWLADDFAVLDERRFYLRGLLEIPVRELDSRFGYGVWVEVAEADFQHLLEHWHDPAQGSFAPVDARLANELAPYDATEGLPVAIEPVSAESLPSVRLLGDEHPLCIDQRYGISAARSDELAATVMRH